LGELPLGGVLLLRRGHAEVERDPDARGTVPRYPAANHDVTPVLRLPVVGAAGGDAPGGPA
jgi:hypothetical protein